METPLSRTDVSPYLVHFTSGEDHEQAFKRLQKIIAEKKLIGGTRCIKGKYSCVCFSEAPLGSLTNGLVNEEYYSRYSPFGILVSKQWLFAMRGRPVIYQTANEYKDLPEGHRWRHVLYELRENFSHTDFTWEREWRIKCDCLEFDQKSARIVVRDRNWAQRLIAEHDKEQDYSVMQYGLIFNETIAEAWREKFQWTVLTLR